MSYTLYEHPQGLLSNGIGQHMFTGKNAGPEMR